MTVSVLHCQPMCSKVPSTFPSTDEETLKKKKTSLQTVLGIHSRKKKCPFKLFPVDQHRTQEYEAIIPALVPKVFLGNQHQMNQQQLGT